MLLLPLSAKNRLNKNQLIDFQKFVFIYFMILLLLRVILFPDKKPFQVHITFLSIIYPLISRLWHIKLRMKNENEMMLIDRDVLI
jgi:hypothetical protein